MQGTTCTRCACRARAALSRVGTHTRAPYLLARQVRSRAIFTSPARATPWRADRRSARRALVQLRTLCDFRFTDSSGQDQGINVREKSRQICEILNDRERLKEERDKARAPAPRRRPIPTHLSLIIRACRRCVLGRPLPTPTHLSLIRVCRRCVLGRPLLPALPCRRCLPSQARTNRGKFGGVGRETMQGFGSDSSKGFGSDSSKGFGSSGGSKCAPTASSRSLKRCHHVLVHCATLPSFPVAQPSFSAPSRPCTVHRCGATSAPHRLHRPQRCPLPPVRSPHPPPFSLASYCPPRLRRRKHARTAPGKPEPPQRSPQPRAARH